jgi:L-seryl-tRNA(Ser) seleniumtransferase
MESGPFAALCEVHPRALVVRSLRAVLDEVRAGLEGESPSTLPDNPGEWAALTSARVDLTLRPSLRRTINATGVVLHTNLGRAPLAPVAVAAMAGVGEGYSNLEFDLEEGRRGSRYVHCVGLLRELTGAEDALVVNNCAAALVLALNTAARGRGVAVSRGELVEIGGGFRIPEMLDRSGSRLVEVGATNRTRIGDYEEAAESAGEVGAILKVHRSNFRITGFTEEASLAEVVELAGRMGIPSLFDLGSGLFLPAGLLGLPEEPTVPEAVRSGVDAVVVSGDKLLGGPQAGLILGKEALISEMRSNPLCRALRVDKVALAGLEATLALYRDPAVALRAIPTLRMLAAPIEEIAARAETIRAGLAAGGLDSAIEAGASLVGGGTYPGVELASRCVRIPSGSDGEGRALAAAARRGDPPVVCRLEDDDVLLDARTIDPDEVDAVVACLVRAREGL